LVGTVPSCQRTSLSRRTRLAGDFTIPSGSTERRTR
jgi:hypothetical protein